jgi:hypothetical protein
MGILSVLNNKSFNILFSFLLGIGIICIIRVPCKGSECNITKAPSDSNFEDFVYRMGGGKCYEFKSEVLECPAVGAVEPFQQRSGFATRETFITI